MVDGGLLDLIILFMRFTLKPEFFNLFMMTDEQQFYDFCNYFLGNNYLANIVKLCVIL